MGRALFFIFMIFLFLFLDVYVYHGFTSLFTGQKSEKISKWVYGIMSGLTYLAIAYLIWRFQGGQGLPREEWVNITGGFVFTMFITKLVFGGFLLLQDLGRFTFGGVQYAAYQLTDKMWTEEGFIPGRRQFLTSIGTVVAGIPFFSLLYGITKGKYQYTVEKIVLTFKDLPKAFDGFTIVQISDVHAGSFDNKDKVRGGIEKIQSLNPDMICFTGDLVNAEKEEIDPFVDLFASLQAPYGKYAVLGNHDYYGTYDRNSPVAEQNYFADFYERYKAMGFDLLNNTRREIVKAGEKLQLLGVENWGAGRWFPKRGDLNLAMQGMPDNSFSVLMSHDPTHYDEVVKNHATPVHLTMSGHTHGFQFGVKIPGFKWSPAQYRYPKWSGLYEENDRKLYVNRGFGFLGFPGRVGMWPEITQFELRREESSAS